MSLAEQRPAPTGGADLSSRYVDVAGLPWNPTGHAGVDFKLLYRDADTGMSTGLFRFAPGASLPLHEHVEIEQSFVLQGSLEDHEGRCTEGNFVWRPAGSRHVATAPNGALILGMLMRPNRFMETT